MGSNYVFVYGTLLTGEPNHGLLSHIKASNKNDDVMIRGDLYNLGAYPGAYNVGVSNYFIHGEVYLVDDDTLRSLDQLEGYRGTEYRSTNLYNRYQVPVFNRYGELYLQSVYVYEYNFPDTPTSPRIEHGIWKERNNKDYIIDNPVEYDDEGEDLDE